MILKYFEDGITHQLLTTKSILFMRDVVLSTDQAVKSEDEREVFRKRQTFVLKCKGAAWRRFHREYLVDLRDRHNLNYKDKLADIQIDDALIIKGKSKNREHWKL